MGAEIYTVRTTAGREEIVIDLLSSKLKAEVLDIKTIFHPSEIRGYIFVEGSLGSVQKAVQGLMHIKGIIEKPLKLEEIQHFLEYKKTRLKLNMDDVVEIIGGPFKGERGKITRVDTVKGEITIELLEAAIPIPVTVSSEFVKIVKRARPEEPEKEEEQEKQRAEPEPAREETAEAEEEREESVFDNLRRDVAEKRAEESKPKKKAKTEDEVEEELEELEEETEEATEDAGKEEADTEKAGEKEAEDTEEADEEADTEEEKEERDAKEDS